MVTCCIYIFAKCIKRQCLILKQNIKFRIKNKYLLFKRNFYHNDQDYHSNKTLPRNTFKFLNFFKSINLKVFIFNFLFYSHVAVSLSKLLHAKPIVQSHLSFKVLHCIPWLNAKNLILFKINPKNIYKENSSFTAVICLIYPKGICHTITSISFTSI